MKSVYDTIIAVRKTSSKNEKLAILEKQKHNTALQEFLRKIRIVMVPVLICSRY